MKISHYQLRTLIESVILEGFKNDQQYLAEKYPESAQDIFRLQPKWISWLMVRFGDSPTQKEIHPFSDAIVTVLNFSKKDAAIGEKWKSNEQFRAAINARFPEGERAWRSPADAMTMTVDQMELILGLYERKKQRIELKDENFESDRVGKVGPWNIWLPTTRENSCKIAGYDPITMKPKTTWCTARTSGSNLFYNYVGQSGQETTLFYIIKDDPVEDADWLSLGFADGKLDLSGRYGGLTVDRANAGLTADELQSIFGSYYSRIIDLVTTKNNSLAGKHPAKQKIIDAAQSAEGLQYLLKGIQKDEATDIKKIVSADQNLQPDVMRILAADHDQTVRWNISKNKNIPSDVFLKLAADSNHEVRVSIARNQNIPYDILYKLAEDSNSDVRISVAKNKNVSHDILIKLAKDNHPDVKKNIAQIENIPVDILRILAEDSDGTVRAQVANNRNIPLDVFLKFAEDHDVIVRAEIAKNENTSPDLLSKLAKDSMSSVKVIVAQNKNTPQNILFKLAEDSNFMVRTAVAKNENAHADTLRILAKDSDEDIRAFVALNSNTPIDILRQLADNHEWQVKSAVAQNKNTPSDILSRFAEDSDDDVRVNIAANKNSSPDILDMLATDHMWKVRMHVARNPNTRQETLKKFENDPHPRVRRIVNIDF